MPNNQTLEYWTVWYPEAAATGLLLARAQVDPAKVMLLHAAPGVITVEVTDAHGRRLAYGADLKRTLDSPMCRLRREGDRVTREDTWPGPDDLGVPVLLPGGEAGILQQWWHAPDQQEWRWQVEFYNSKR
jgi:hypothetical protein